MKKPAKLKVLIAASECAPFAKVGGLADVIGSLPKALHKLGVDVRVVIPRYQQLNLPNNGTMKQFSHFFVDFEEGQEEQEVKVYESKLPDSEVPIYFFKNDKYLSSGGIYFSKDAFVSSQEEIKRFAFFSKAVAEFLRASLVIGVVHANDWHTGMIPNLTKNSKFKIQNYQPATVFTIHNLANQGFADLSILKNLNSVTAESQLIKWDAQDDNLDFMLQGITNADVVSTVSPTYAKEILTPEFGEGLHQVLKAREARLFGILNGIDYDVWNPATDPLLEFNYDLTKNLEEGLSKKLGNKLHLQKHLGLKIDEKVPLMGMVNRLAAQKGLDILLDTLPEILDLGPQLVILGVGDPELEKRLSTINNQQSTIGNFAFINRFDEELAHRIYAGADLFLMPSQFEPCGLVQLIAMRYGALPIVRGVGGLKDTVKDGETGFVFGEYSPEALIATVERALACCGLQTPAYRPMVKAAASQDFSWEARAKEYLHLYKSALKYREKSLTIN
jgi:starch synthase